MPENETDAPAPAAASGGLLSGVKGWIIVGAVVLLQTAFFLVYIHFAKAPVDKDPNDEQEDSSSLLDDRSLVVPVKDLTYPLQAGAPPTIVVMEISLLFGYTEEEKRNPKAPNVPKPEILAAYRDYGQACVDSLKSHLNLYMTTVQPSDVRGSTGFRKIQDEIKTYMNGLMRQYVPNNKVPAGLDRNRVTVVELPVWRIMNE